MSTQRLKSLLRRAAFGAIVPTALFFVTSAHADISGFGDGSGYTLNGGATISGGVLSLTDQVNSQARSVFYNTKQPLTDGGFTASFTYTATAGGTAADGFAFVLQNDARGALALGAAGGSVGFGGDGSNAIRPSSAVVFNVYGTQGTDFRMNGSTGTGNGQLYNALAPVDLFSGPANITLSYDGSSTLTQTITDANSNMFTKVYGNVLPRYIANGANSVFVGFAGGTGGFNVAQSISNFSFTTSGTQLTLPQDVTQATDAVVGSSANTPAVETADKTIDNNPYTKLLNFDKLNTGVTITPGAGATIVTGLSLISANDAPERDPASFILEGSNDNGATWQQITTGNINPFTSRYQEQDITFSNSSAYQTYRLTFPTVANATIANSMQLAEVELLGTVAVPEPASLSLLALGGLALLARRRRH